MWPFKRKPKAPKPFIKVGTVIMEIEQYSSSGAVGGIRKEVQNLWVRQSDSDGKWYAYCSSFADPTHKSLISSGKKSYGSMVRSLAYQKGTTISAEAMR